MFDYMSVDFIKNRVEAAKVYREKVPQAPMLSPKIGARIMLDVEVTDQSLMDLMLSSLFSDTVGIPGGKLHSAQLNKRDQNQKVIEWLKDRLVELENE